MLLTAARRAMATAARAGTSGVRAPPPPPPPPADDVVDVLVVGGSMVGLSLAAELGECGGGRGGEG